MREKKVKVVIRKVTRRSDGAQALLRIPVSIWREWQTDYVQMIITSDEIVVRPLRDLKQ